MNSIRTFCLLFIGFLIPNGMLHAQQSLGDKRESHSAFEAFQQGQYLKVINSFDSQNPRNANEQILYLLSKLKAGDDTSKEIAEWIDQNEKDPLLMLAHFYEGEYFFYQGDTVKSSHYLKKVRYPELSEQDQAAFGFIYGLISLQNKKYKSARSLFNISEKNGYDDPSELAYYQGFTLYHLDLKEEALNSFGEAQDHPHLGLSSKFFIAKIQLELANYDEVISLAQGELNEQKSKVNAGFHQLIGEAHALKGNLSKADAYFDQAIKIHPGRPTAALYYQAGVSKFKLGNQDKALNYLTEAGIGAGPYAQLSAFQLGRLHIKRKEFEKALTAFKEATSSEDNVIQEESIYQSAKLNAKLKRFTEAINYSNDYLRKYPEGQWKDEMEDLIAETYLRTSDYDLAISHLEKVGLRGAKQQEVYQKVSYQKGTLLFNDGNFDDALPWFQKSLSYPLVAELSDEAHFFIAEILMQKGSYTKAIASYKNQRSLNPMSHYGMAYAYFNQRAYTQAIPHFKSASLITEPDFKRDATLRLADCYYATKAYERALTTYSELNDSDYVLFQKGLVLKNIGKIQQARRSFSLVSSASSWKDDALFNKALLEFEIAAFENAESGFSELITNHPQSIYRSRAYLNRGTTRSNRKNLSGAVSDYEYVIDNYIQTGEAFSAILGLQELKQKGVATGDIDSYIALYKRANPEDGSLELVEFESAKSDYFDLAYSNAIPKLISFNKAYPKSKFKSEAQYYLGDAYYRTQQLERANEVLQKQKFVRNNYTGRVLDRLGSINYQLQNYDQSIDAYELLLGLNLSAKDNFNAMEGLMDSHFAVNHFERAIQQADKILRSDWKPANADRKAMHTKAKSQLRLDQIDLAKKSFNELSKGTDQYAAEAAFQVGKLTYEEGKYDEALEMLFLTTEKFGSYIHWIEKSYLLIADVYLAKEELFQAKATLRSIIQHSKNDEIRNEAQRRLDKIETTIMIDTTQVKEE